MANVRSILISAIFCLFLLGPALLFAGQEKLHLDLPSWLTAEDATYLSGGYEEAHVAKHFSIKGFTSEKLQTNLETAVNNHVPLKASVLLGNAALQRTAIAASNLTFSFPAYPTYYGSEKIFSPDFNALARIPESEKGEVLAGTRETATGLLSVAKANPKVEFCVIVADESNNSEANPAFNLVSSRVTTTECVNTLEETLSEASNVHIVSVSYEDSSKYYQNYYTTDHHWNGYGTIAVFNAVEESMGFQNSRDNEGTAIEFSGLAINGSCSREGLMFLDESAKEPAFDLTGLEVENKKKPPLISKDSVEKLLETGQKAEFMFYSSWYGTYQLAAVSPLVNTEAPADSPAIVIQDSFNNSLHWLLSQNHSRLECFSDTKPSKERHTLQERIDATEAETVYLVGNVSAIRRLTNEQPDYFDLDHSKS